MLCTAGGNGGSALCGKVYQSGGLALTGGTGQFTEAISLQFLVKGINGYSNSPNVNIQIGSDKVQPCTCIYICQHNDQEPCSCMQQRPGTDGCCIRCLSVSCKCDHLSKPCKSAIALQFAA